jgi:hypothetical protein
MTWDSATRPQPCACARVQGLQYQGLQHLSAQRWASYRGSITVQTRSPWAWSSTKSELPQSGQVCSYLSRTESMLLLCGQSSAARWHGGHHYDRLYQILDSVHNVSKH